jgi:hypothetical protein
MADAVNVGRSRTIELFSARGINLATKERFPAFLCVLVVVAGVLLGLMYMIGFGFP